MKNKITLQFIVLNLLIIIGVFGQNNIDLLNKLPLTLEVRAPEFNTVKKYFFKIDSANNFLYIQDLRKSKSDEIHYYQWLYEISLSDIDSQSFKIEKIIDTPENYIKLTIRVNKNLGLIKTYWFQDSKISNIGSSIGIGLEKWLYTDKLFQEFNDITSSITLNSKTESKTNLGESTVGTYKYISGNVVTRNATMDPNPKINGYDFIQSFSNSNLPIYKKLIKRIKTAIKNQNIDNSYPLPCIVYFDKTGVVESVTVITHKRQDVCKVDITNLKIKNITSPSKSVFLVYKL